MLIAFATLAATVAGLGILAGAAFALRQAAVAPLSSGPTVRWVYDVEGRPGAHDTPELPIIREDP